MARIDIAVEQLSRLYVEEQRTAAEIAEIMNCSQTTVRRRLAEHGIPARRRGTRVPIEPLHPALPGSTTGHGWSAPVAYAIGLITTDGNLSPDGRHITFVSADRDLHDVYKSCLGLSNQTGRHGSAFHTTFSDVAFYRWLVRIGLMPDKSFRLHAIDVPDTYLSDFIRGCLDGDGSISMYLDPYNARKHHVEHYVYWRLFVRFFSASRPFLEWLQRSAAGPLGLTGSITASRSIWRLSFAKRDSLRLLSWLYYSHDVPCLERKRARFLAFLAKSNLTI